MSVRVRPSYVVLATLALLLTAGAAACGGDDASDLPPPPSATDQTPGLDLSPAEQEAVDEARARFDEFMSAYIDVSTADVPTADEAEDLFARVEREAAGLLPQELRTEIVGRWGENQIMDETVIWEFSNVVTTDLNREVEGSVFPRVVSRYCIDNTGWLPVDADTAETAGEPGERRIWTVVADWSDDWGGLGQGPEGWRIAARDEMVDQPC